nr:type VI secretion system baseplate subunit TssE [uncultured Lichenicoccus sp.]
MKGGGRGTAVRSQPRRVLMPLLDRLIDDAPDRPDDPALTAGQALEALRNAVRRDLELLLNSRRRWRGWSPDLANLAGSALGFGIPDCAAGAYHDKRERETLRAEIEDTIRRFEPRFSHVRVTLDDRDPLAATLRLQIEATLHAEPAPEAIVFETLVDVARSNVTVRATDV